MELRSNSFKAGATIPNRYTCDGENISPSLTWTDAPKDTKSFALIVEDPDAPRGTYTHWVAYNIPRELTGLPPGAGNKPGDYSSGKNDFGKLEYGGPCPPPGQGAHRYFFHVFALDTVLNIPPGGSKTDIESAMLDHIIDHAQMMARFGR